MSFIHCFFSLCHYCLHNVLLCFFLPDLLYSLVKHSTTRQIRFFREPQETINVFLSFPIFFIYFVVNFQMSFNFFCLISLFSFPLLTISSAYVSRYSFCGIAFFNQCLYLLFVLLSWIVCLQWKSIIRLILTDNHCWINFCRMLLLCLFRIVWFLN